MNDQFGSRHFHSASFHPLVSYVSPSRAPLVSPQQADPPRLALDIGETIVRPRCSMQPGRTVDSASPDARTLYTGSSGAAVVDADAVIGLIFRCVDETLALAGPLAGSIATVAGCSFVGNRGRGPRRADHDTLITYADTFGRWHGTAQAELDERDLHQHTGVRFHPSYGTAPLLAASRTLREFRRRALECRWGYMETMLFAAGGTGTRLLHGAACSIGSAWIGTSSC